MFKSRPKVSLQWVGTGGKMGKGTCGWVQGPKRSMVTSKDQKRAKFSTSITSMQGNLPLVFKEAKVTIFEKSGGSSQDSSLLKWA